MLLLVLPFAFYQVYGFFTLKSSKGLPAPAPAASSTSTSRPSSPPSTASNTNKSEWRILGYYQSPHGRYVYLYQPPDKYRTLIDPINFFYNGIHVSGYVDGAPVSNWSGTSSGVSSSLFSPPLHSQSRSAP